jgi:hypothetical protein
MLFVQLKSNLGA